MKYAYRMCFFRPMDSDAVERYLSRKARKGWQLDKTGQMFWRFRRENPAALTYAVTYFPEASVYGGALTPAQVFGIGESTLESRLLWAIWLRQSERSVEQGGPCAPSFFGLSRGLEIGALILVTALLVQGLWYAQRSGAGGALWWGAGIMAVVLACTLGPVWWMRERGYDESSIRNVTILIAVLIGVVAVGAVADQYIVTPNEPVWGYEGEEARDGIYVDSLPLRLEDLGVSTEGLPYSTSRRRFSRSPFLSQVSADHTCPPAEELPGEQPELEYTMVHVACPLLYDTCREELSWPDMALVEDGRWQAEAVPAPLRRLPGGAQLAGHGDGGGRPLAGRGGVRRYPHQRHAHGAGVLG